MQGGDVLGGRFRILARVNAGGMGEIHRAVDLDTGEIVATKLPTHTAPEALERFEREAAALAQLSHPGIVRHIAHGVSSDGRPFLAMEWLDGEDLAERLSRRRLSTAEVVQLGTRIAAGLGAAHAAGIVHRDLKPSNVFLAGGSLEHPKLLDFGIAHVADGLRLTHTGTLIGTPSYMAPELVRSEGIVDSSADVFSLGCVLFECLTGAPPFRAAHAIAVLAKIVFEAAPRTKDLCAEVPLWLDELLARMLSKDPSGRPRNGLAVAAVLATRDAVRALRPQSPPSVLGGSERHFLGIVLRGHTSTRSETSRPSITLTSSLTGELRGVAARFGGQLELFTDGTAAIVLNRTSVPTDIAVDVARCALALRERAPGVPMAVAAGWAERSGGIPVGDAIDRAARLLHTQGASEAGAAHIAIDEAAARLLDDRFEIAHLAHGGLELRGERPAGHPWRSLLGRPSPCVGRERDLALLELMFAGSVAEPAVQVVVISGPAGIGKSRLLHEFREQRRCAAEPVQIWVARCDPLRAASTYGLVAELLRRASAIRGGEPLHTRRELLSRRVARHVPERERRRVTEFLGELSGIAFSDEDSLPLRAARQDPELLGDHMQRALRDFLRAECGAQPLILVLEDVHWSDRASLTALHAALRELADQPLLLLASARPEIDELFPGLFASCGRHDLRLRALSPKESAQLARKALGDTVSATVIERVVALSEGHPFFLEELIRAAVEHRGDALPGSVVAMVQSRLERLDPAVRRVLRAASILGEVFWRGAVVHLCGTDDEAAVLAALSTLVAREICIQRRESRFPGEQEYSFRQALLREGAYSLLTAEDRALGHRLAGEWLDQQGEADPLVLAEHFERGGVAARAGALFLRGAELGGARGDYHEAERCYGRAALLLGVLPRAARRSRGLTLFRLGRHIDALAELSAACAQAAADEDTAAEVEILLDEAMVLDWMGEYRAAEQHVCAAQSHRAAVSSPLIEARLLLGEGRSQHRAGRIEEATVTLAHAAQSASYLGDEGYETHVIALLLLGFILPGLGRMYEAAYALNEVIDRCEQRGDRLHLGAALSNRALVRAYRGDRSGMVADFERTIALGRELGQPMLEFAGHFNLGEYLYLMDDLDAAAPHVQAAGQLGKLLHGGEHPAVVALLEARLHLYRGDETQARAIAAHIRAKHGGGGASGAGEPLSPSEDVLCTMIELSVTDGGGRVWDALEIRSGCYSVGQEHIEVLEARSLADFRRGRREEALRQIEKALAAAARIPNVMGERLQRWRARLYDVRSPSRYARDSPAFSMFIAID